MRSETIMQSDSEVYLGTSSSLRTRHTTDYVRRVKSMIANVSGLGPRILTKLYSMWVSAIYPFASKGKKISIHYTCDIRNPELISLGNFVIVHKDAWLHGVPPRANNDRPNLTIRDMCLIGRRSHISAHNCIDLGPGVIVSASALIQDHGHAYEDVTLPIRLQGLSKGGTVRIEEGCWIGQGAAIVCAEGELVLGRNSVVAANALVTRSAPPYSVLSGNPARVVKQYDLFKKKWVLGSVAPRKGESEQPVPATTS